MDKSYVFESSAPYPNPSDGQIAMSYMEFSPKEIFETKVFIYDSKGIRIGILEKRISDVEYFSNGKLERGEYISDLELQTGIYFLIIDRNDKTESKPIVITR